MSDIPSWWPHRAASCRVRVAPHDWHVQIIGTGPDVLLLHGAGASTHSWRGLAGHLPGFRLLIPDLPGHGFTRTANPMRLGIDAMAEDLAALARAQDWQPQAVVGHSAGGALAFRLSGALPVAPAALVGICAALDPFQGMAGWAFPRIARAMAMTPALPHVLARIASRSDRVARAILNTGSELDAEGIALYRELIRRPSHVQGMLGMMAQWDLAHLPGQLEQTRCPVLLISAGRDRAVPPLVADRAARRIRRSELVSFADLGHLCHEEAPARIAAPVHAFLSRNLSGALHSRA